MSDSTKLTTAKLLGKFRKELISNGIPTEETEVLVRDAFRSIVQDEGIEVEND